MPSSRTKEKMLDTKASQELIERADLILEKCNEEKRETSVEKGKFCFGIFCALFLVNIWIIWILPNPFKFNELLQILHFRLSKTSRLFKISKTMTFTIKAVDRRLQLQLCQNHHWSPEFPKRTPQAKVLLKLIKSEEWRVPAKQILNLKLAAVLEDFARPSLGKVILIWVLSNLLLEPAKI